MIAVAWLALSVASFVYVAGIFGTGMATVLSVLLALPLVVLARMYWWWPSVRYREFLYPAILAAVTLFVWGFGVQNAYTSGLHHRHAENVRWQTFERRFSKDPAFRFIHIHKTTRKNIHWASGTVATEADLDRLRALAVECGIEGRRIDGPFVHSVSVTIGPGF